MNEQEKALFDSLRGAYSGLRFDVKDAVQAQLRNLGVRMDANESIMFARELEHIFAKTYDVQYPGLKARSLIPVNTEVPNGAETHTYTQYDWVGEAKPISDYARDFPTVEIKGAQFTKNVVSFGDSYAYSMQDLRAAAMAKKPLDAMKATAARRAMENTVEKLAALGTAAYGDAGGLTGLLNAPNVDTASLTNGSWWTLLTGSVSDADVLAVQSDVKQLRNTIKAATKTVYSDGFTLLVDTTTKSYLETTPQSPTFKDLSVEQFLLRSVKGLVAIEEWIQCDTASSGSPKLVMYPKLPEVLEMVVPQEFEQFPPQLLGMAFKVFCHMRHGGTTVRYPKACLYATNHAA